MVRITLFSRDGALCGFRMSGHAGGTAGHDIVCAAVSSAALMAVNTVTDVCGCHAVTRMRDGYLLLSVGTRDIGRCEETLEGLQLHLEQLERQYPRKLTLGVLEI